MKNDIITLSLLYESREKTTLIYSILQKMKVFVLCTVFLCMEFCCRASATEMIKDHHEDEETDEEEELINFIDSLEELTDTELEDICRSRGFELVFEYDENNEIREPFSHEDFVEAAQQCLDIEAEMMQMVNENPNILEELQAENDRMLAEKERLEKEHEKLLLEKSERMKKKENNECDDPTPTFIVETDENKNICTNTTTTTTTAIEAKPSEIPKSERQKDTKIQFTGNKVSQKNNTQPHTSYNRLALKELIQDTIDEFKEQVQKDIQIICNFVLPPSVRDPLMTNLILPILRVAKHTGHNTLDFMKRYIMANLPDQKDSAEQSKES